MNWTLVQNSLLVGGSVTALAVGLGLVGSLYLGGLDHRWRKALLGLAILALALPPFLVTNCWMELLSDTGIWRRWLPLNLYSIGGAIWILALMYWPVTLLLALGTWEQLEASQLESDPALSGVALVRYLLWPMVRPVVATAAVLVFVLALNNFAVPAILQVKVLPAQVWINFSTNLDSGGALQTGWPLMVAPLALLWFWSPRQIQWPRLEGGISAKLFRRQLGRAWVWPCGLVTWLLVALSVGVPLAQLAASRRTWEDFSPALAAGAPALGNSFGFAVLTAILAVILGLATARWQTGWPFWLPLLAPGIFWGIALIWMLNRPGLDLIYRSPGIIMLAWLGRYLAPGRTMAARAWSGVDRDLRDAARLNGANGWQMFRHVQWPQIAPQLAGAGYVVYLLCLWDVETLVLVQPPGGETLALRVFNLLHYGHTNQVNALCLMLLALAALPLAGWLLWRGFRRPGQAGGVGLALVALMLAGCAPPLPPGERPLASSLFSRVCVIGTRGTGPGQFNKPRSVAVDQADNLYVVDMTGRVQKLSPTGQFLLSWQMPQTDLGKPKGMARDPAGRILVIEPHYQRINHFSPAGQLVEQWGCRGTNDGEFILPRAIAVNSRGDYYVSEYTLQDRVQAFGGSDKKLLRAWGRAGAGPGEFNRAEGLDCDAADRVYVADSCNHRIQVFAKDGAFLRSYGRPGGAPGELSYPYDIRVDEAGRQYVCEFGNSRVQIFDAQDRPLEILGGPGAAPGQFNNPWSIALDAHGNLYVADANNHRVQKFIRRASAKAS